MSELLFHTGRREPSETKEEGDKKENALGREGGVALKKALIKPQRLVESKGATVREKAACP